MGKFNFGAVSNTINENKTVNNTENIVKKEVSVQPPVKEAIKDKKKEIVKDNKVPQDINTISKKAVEKILQIEDDLKGYFVERDNEIRMISLALIAGVNAFFHGPAGTGKSALIEEYNKRIINSVYFRWLLSKTTEPGEIFGPSSIEAMKRDIFKFNTKGKLPEATISFLDECFKANSAVLNSLLTIMNEKYFFNDGIQKVPLISLFGASNEYPEDDSLDALYDRFLLRCHVNYVQDNKNRITLFDNFLNARSGSSKFNKAALTLSPTAFIDIDEIRILNEKCKEVNVPKKVLNSYNKLLNSLAKNGIEISDRRKNESLKVIQATALLNGRDKAGVEDLESLIYSLWIGDESQIQTIADEIIKVSNPLREKYNGFKEGYDKRIKEIDALDPNDQNFQHTKTIKVTECCAELKKSIESINTILKNLSKEGRLNDSIFIDFTTLKGKMADTVEQFVEDLMN